MDKGDDNSQGWSRRNFLQTVSVGAPTLTLVMDHGHIPDAMPQVSPSTGGRFHPMDLKGIFTASSADFGPRPQAQSLGAESARDRLIRTPAGERTFRGIPFVLGPEGTHEKRWLVLSEEKRSWTVKSVDISARRGVGFFCLASFCDWDKNEAPPPGEDLIEQVGQRLAEAILVYDDGSETTAPIRRRFEVGPPSIPWGHLCFASVTHTAPAPQKLSDPLRNGMDWGNRQTAIGGGDYAAGPIVWISSLRNPNPDKPLKLLRLRSTSADPLVICGITEFNGRENPLRYERLRLYRLTLPDAAAKPSERWKLGIDLGVVGRTFLPNQFDPETWLRAPRAGLGGRERPAPGNTHLYAEISASPEATLTLTDSQTGKLYEFDLGRVSPGVEWTATPDGARIQVIETEKVWLHGRVLDAATRRPTPVRIAFRSKEGRYIPPYGHRTEINDAWFEDYGADVKLMDESFAYVDGTFQVELPVGEVFVEITKGFEYSPVRRRLQIEPNQRELQLEVSRFTDLRSRGWVTADTHVHFLSPSTAILEGQSEGLNLISLLAAQWGDLFTNVGDLSYGPLLSQDGETMVQVNTENRQHVLGHLGLVGGIGAPVFPMSADGPDESSLGGPLWNSLAEWTDAQKKRDGLVVAVHFPYPTAELAADIVLGKIDAVELFPYGEYFNTLRFLDWYRYLNCGYRLPAVGGTDKMGAYMPAGTNRTYAHLGKQEFTFANWAKAVRSGNTFMTTGPLLVFQCDGHTPGEEIAFGAGGGTVEARVEAKSFVPFHRLELVLNGKVVASREEKSGTKELSLEERVRVPGSGWLAARCASRLGPTTNWGLGIQAHTSPVYFAVPGQDPFDAPSVAYMLTLIEGAEIWTENFAVRSDPDRMARALKVLRDAREILHRRMHEHGISH
ncbi:MAG TPA: CehA/McbA family metallohydrolase [Acidobacteriota bacterium]|nr:CehA/McbA family metallohydrolase [Acidobacteriota bacterium]